LADALDAAEEARTCIEQVATGSGQDEFHQVSDSFRQAVEGIGDLQQKLTAIQRDVTAMANRLEGGVRRTGPPSAGQTPSAHRISAARVAELLAALPVRSRANRKTSGYWINDTGKLHGLVTSGQDEAAAVASEVLIARYRTGTRQAHDSRPR
jgi:hypothetical protein